MLLDESFIRQGQIKKLCGKRRFTLAHECAHQILYQMESDEVKQYCNRQYSARTAYSLRDLKTHEDWNEWQANVLGAAILMPQKEIDLAAWYFIPEKKLTSYGGYFSYRDRMSLRAICSQLGVSKVLLLYGCVNSATSKTALIQNMRTRWRCGHEKNIRITEPSAEMQTKIQRARIAIASQRGERWNARTVITIPSSF